MKLLLTRDTFVRIHSGTVVEVDASEGSRLIALHNAVPVVEEPKEDKKTPKKKTGK